MRLKTSVKKGLSRIVEYASQQQANQLSHWRMPNPEAQKLLMMQYRQMVSTRSPLPVLEETGFKAYSQSDEDGILLYIFSLIGFSNRLSVELCVESGIECNSANLIINHGWHSLLFDGSEINIRQGYDFYTRHPQTWLFPPRLVSAWIDADNINELIQNNGFSGPVDMLAVDIDGVDYWIWKAITVLDPQVVVAEINPGLGSERCITVPYKPDFVWNRNDPKLQHYYGVSLNAIVKLAREKGYRFVGTNRWEYNAFFVKNGVCEDVLPERSTKDYLHGLYAREKIRQVEKQGVLNCQWVDV